ncbi:amidohydrolase family protein [Thermoproteota archaeon]
MSTMKIGIEGGFIIAYDGDEHRLLENGILVYEEDKIIHVGKSYSGRVDKKIDARGKMVIPGLVDIHSHISGCPFERAYRGDGSTKELHNSDLYDRAPAVWASQTKHDKEIAIKCSLAEMLRGGITTVVDMGSVDGVGVKESVKLAMASGIRAYLLKGHQSGGWYSKDGHTVSYHNFDGEKWDEDEGFKKLEEAIGFIKECNNSYHGRIRSFLYPEKVDTCSPDLFKETRKIADEHNLLMESHVSQSWVEFTEIMRRYGKTPIKYLKDLGVMRDDFITGHGIFISGHSMTGFPDPWGIDIGILAESGTTVAHCPTPFVRYGIAMESYSKYLGRGVKIGLGTDTSPQDLINEMRTASYLSKIIESEARVATAKQVFDSATIVGADALKRSDLGRLTPGAKADIVLINLRTFNMCPITDPIMIFVRNGNRNDVDTVIVDGKTLVENGRVLGFDERIFNELQKSMDNIVNRIPENDRINRTIDDIIPPSLKKWEE